MIKIIIGREPESLRLKLVSGKTTKLMGEQGSVPKGVSREHAAITVDDNDRIFVENLNGSNVTFVEGKQFDIMKCEVGLGDTLFLGQCRFRVTVESVVHSFVKAKVEVSHLEWIWNDYNDFNLKEQKKMQRLNLWRTVSSLLTTTAIASGILLADSLKGGGNPFKYLYGGALVIMFGITIWTFMQSGNAEKKRERLEKFQEEYSCPSCGVYFGMMPYKVLIKRGKCGNCGTQFKTPQGNHRNYPLRH